MKDGQSVPHTHERLSPSPAQPSPAITIKSVGTILREDCSVNQRAFLYKRGKSLLFYCNENRMHTFCFFKQLSPVERIIMFLKCLNGKHFSEWWIWKYVHTMIPFCILLDYGGELPQVKRRFINWFPFSFFCLSFQNDLITTVPG